jgi:hypothetical protein
MNQSSNTIVGTAGGTLFTAIMIESGDILQTAILAAVGACVSYVVSVCMRRLFEESKRK